ncbi:PepSY domain-containing protein [Ottowia caeni]|uniref:PepSY domain-containing protein n=1 Tax=Ottowia caeni TaxID=2870339 RepID=UPI001E3B2175|nr:PepSY domain-containing protein [Ottowia caeni]
MKQTPFFLALCVALASAPALADDDCEVPAKQWQSRDAVLQHANRQGWQVQRIKIDDGCYEIRGRDDKGRAFKAKLDPQTLQVVKMKLRDDDDDHERKRRRESDSTKSQGTTPSITPPPNPVLTPGTTPRGQVE